MFLFKRTFSLWSGLGLELHPSFSDSNGQQLHIIVTISGPLNANGVVIPYTVIDNVLENLKEKFNDITADVPNPTLEHLSDFLFTKLSDRLASSPYAATHTLESVEIVPQRYPDIKIERRKD